MEALFEGCLWYHLQVNNIKLHENPDGESNFIFVYVHKILGVHVVG
jgi:hypothetical protein